MAILHVGFLLVFLCVAGGQSLSPPEEEGRLLRRLSDENVLLRREGRQLPSAVNLKQCSKRNLHDSREYGVLMRCALVKKRDDSVLRVVWNGDLRLVHDGHQYGSCRRWFFTINGKECRQPETIDTQLLIRDKTTNIHRPAYVEGYCRGIAAGHVTVVWNVGDCPNQAGNDVGDSLTGWISTVRIIVEEVDVQDAGTAIL
ncbi:hypothetical protein LSAT2_032506 [Lamellibrachia satsuma]|nr:hypothetical protein LSAT2_032506 [Lamellibrachia satsuma]